MSSKRLNKRQAREQEELAALRAQQPEIAPPEAEGQVEDSAEQEDAVFVPNGRAEVMNTFAALNPEEDESVEEELSDNEPEVAVKKSKKKKSKKKKAKTAEVSDPVNSVNNGDQPISGVATPTAKGKKTKQKEATAEEQDDGMDEIDRALAALGGSATQGSTRSGQGDSLTPATETRAAARLRKALAVQTKDLDPDAELKRFFGSKVIASANAANTPSARTARSQKLFLSYIAKMRYTFVKPLPTWPIQASAQGLSMREMTGEEVKEKMQRRGSHGTQLSDATEEKWFTWEHGEAWRQVQYQFLGAIRSHDPNQLQALLSVYSWHIDTLLQLSQVYQQQNDVGAASDFCSRAIFAYDRALVPGFNIGGMCRVDFDRVENRGLFLALHRNVAHLAKRGLWTSAFNYAKLLLSLDPHDDPHGALLWLDLLAIKSNNLDWIIDSADELASAFLPGLAYNRALAIKLQLPQVSQSTETADEALRDAIRRFPQAILILADKAGVTLPQSARSHPMFELQIAYSEDDQTPNNLLCHIYAGRNAPLWKESSNAAWLGSQIAAVVAELSPSQRAQGPHLPFVRTSPAVPGGIPIWLVRHAYLSEGLMGWMPPPIASNLGHAYDPIPPLTAITIYDNEYFTSRQSARGRGRDGADPAGEQTKSLQDLLRGALQGGGQGLDRLFEAMGWGQPNEAMGPEVRHEIARLMAAAEVQAGEGWEDDDGSGGSGEEEEAERGPEAMPGAYH